MSIIGKLVTAAVKLEAKLSTGNDYEEIEYQTIGSSPSDFSKMLWNYGVDHCVTSCDWENGVATTKIIVPRQQAWMADCLGRLYGSNGGNHFIISPPFWDSNKRGSDEPAAQGKGMWKPWGVPAKPKTFVSRIMMAMDGSDWDPSGAQNIVSARVPDVVDEVLRSRVKSYRFLD